MSVSSAVATIEPSASKMIKAYADEFAKVTPSHITADIWVSVAGSAFKQGKKDRQTGKYELEVAFLNNPNIAMAELKKAARLGLEPGTEQFYLTPRMVKGKSEILGIVGYQGYIELMYRAGAISSVVAECVYANDKFDFQPGRDERPQHVIDWDAEDRGPLRLTYAYAVMKDGATSKVVVLNKAAITKIKASAQGANSEFSPWKNHEDAMWLKSAVRQLAKWVPTSAEYRTAQLRAVIDAHGSAHVASAGPILEQVDPEPAHDDEGTVYEAELVPDYDPFPGEDS